MAEQSDSSMWSFIKSRPAKHPLARIIGAAVAGIQSEFSPVDGLREVLGLSAEVPAAAVIAMAVGRVVRLKSVADVLGLDVDDEDFIDRVRCIKAIGVDDVEA